MIRCAFIIICVPKLRAGLWPFMQQAITRTGRTAHQAQLSCLSGKADVNLYAMLTHTAELNNEISLTS